MNIKFLNREMFCIKHQSSKEVCVGEDGKIGHLAALFAPDWGWCEGPFAFCPPPELPLDWEKFVEPPTWDEMILIDQNATELAMDLELV